MVTLVLACDFWVSIEKTLNARNKKSPSRTREMFQIMSSPLSYLNFTSCFKFERTAAFCLAECATLFRPEAQKTLLFRFSPRPRIYYCLWVLEGWNEKKKTPRKESISSNFYTLPTAWPWMAGRKTFEAPQIEKEEGKKKKSPCVSRCHPSPAAVFQSSLRVW